MRAVVVEDFTTAEDLLDALGRRNGRWEGRPEGWHFRGQADAEWGLVPASLRPDIAFAYGRGRVLRLADTHGSQAMDELTALAEFLRQLDRQGLPPPDEGLEDLVHGGFVSAAQRLARSREPWPHKRLRPALALAQHHGVPTRLLDWSASPLVAAYFGARDAAGRGGQGGRRLAVWALSGATFALFGIDGARRTLGIETVRPLRHANPNLRAQDGLFTVLLDPSKERDHPPSFPPLDEAIRDLAERSGRETRTFLRKMTLPVQEAGRLLRFLDQEGVSGTYLFPGTDGAVLGLRERGLWEE